MTETEKMLAGKVYDSSDSELIELRGKAHRLCTDYNKTYETEAQKRSEILDELLPCYGSNLYFTAHEPVKTCSEAECFHNKPPAMRVVGKSL